MVSDVVEDEDENVASHQVAKTAQDAEGDEEGRHDDVGDAREVPAAICDATDDDVDSGFGFVFGLDSDD